MLWKLKLKKLTFNKLVSAHFSLNALKTKVDNLDVGNLKSFSVDFKQLSVVVDREFLKNTKFNKLNTKLDKFENKITDAFTLIHINQCNAEKQNLYKKTSDIENKIRNVGGLVAIAVLNNKIVQWRTTYYILVV